MWVCKCWKKQRTGFIRGFLAIKMLISMLKVWIDGANIHCIFNELNEGQVKKPFKNEISNDGIAPKC